MAAPRNRKHILITRSPQAEPYTSHGGGGSNKSPPPPAVGRVAHAATLRAALESSIVDADRRRQQAAIAIHGARPGVYIQFESIPGWELAISSLERANTKKPHKQIEVVAVTPRATTDEPQNAPFVQQAIVFVPNGEIDFFISRLEKYALTTDKLEREQRHENTFDRIANVRGAYLRELWTDDPSKFPVDAAWWEVWLRSTDGRELERLHEYASSSGVQVATQRLKLDDRIIVLVYAKPAQLALALDVLNDIAELRQAKELASFFLQESPVEQAAWARDSVARIRPPAPDSPAVTILDTRVNRGHVLLTPAIDPDDLHAVKPEWKTHDDGGSAAQRGHGTNMAGLALYGDLAAILSNNEPVAIKHRIESVKILPPARLGTNDRNLLGAIMAHAVARPEITQPHRARVFTMAVTADNKWESGQPTSWSAAVDALAAGRAFDATDQGLVYFSHDTKLNRRLFVLSAGNVYPDQKDHLSQSDLEPVEDPAQSWNALTVGASTDLDIIRDPREKGWKPLAARGELSPFSRTSVAFAHAWPYKPDVVAEGGNIGINARGELEPRIDDLSLVTTHHKPDERSFAYMNGTSAACAQVARIAAIVASEYPNLWPETLRALIVHSARWTERMLSAFHDAGKMKVHRTSLLRRYGFGVPSIDRALRSANDAVTLIAQSRIHPFDEGKTREMHIHELPWPTSVLEDLGETEVELRVTLSYFIDPHPARRGWEKRHQYQSHGLRFDVKRPNEDLEDLRKRLNKQALGEGEAKSKAPMDPGWFFGARARKYGSLHSDVWRGTAAELAARGAIAVYPVSGWWKEQPKRDRSRHGAPYALVVSIETPRIQADLWTPIAQEVNAMVTVAR